MGVTLLGAVLIFLSIGLNIQTAESCRCYPLHPQQKFCTSEIVILADITGEDQNNLFQYKIEKIQELNGFNNAKSIQYVYTDSSSCGIRLDHGRYVLSGYRFKDGINVGMCDLVEQWDLLSLTEQENFKQTYKTGCNCMIATCFASPCCPKSRRECKWETSTPQSLEYACLKDNMGTCGWYRAGSKAEEMCKNKYFIAPDDIAENHE